MRPLLYVYLNRDTGLATVRGPDAKVLCQTAAAAQRETGRPWRVVWSDGWCVPISAVVDLQEFAKTLGQVIAVSENPPGSRIGKRRSAETDPHPGQESLL